MEWCVDNFLKNLYLYEQKQLWFSSKCYQYLDKVREDLESVLIIKVTWHDHYAKNDLAGFPDFLSDLYVHAHTSRSSYGLCYVYIFGDNHNFFTSALDKTQDDFCNTILFNNHVLKHVAIEPVTVTLDISELFDRYCAAKK